MGLEKLLKPQGGHACGQPLGQGQPRAERTHNPKNCSQSLRLSGKADTQLLAAGMAVSIVKNLKCFCVSG